MLEWCVLELEWRRRVVWSGIGVASGWRRNVGVLECWSVSWSGVGLFCLGCCWNGVWSGVGVLLKCCWKVVGDVVWSVVWSGVKVLACQIVGSVGVSEC